MLGGEATVSGFEAYAAQIRVDGAGFQLAATTANTSVGLARENRPELPVARGAQEAHGRDVMSIPNGGHQYVA
jgi:hypothetical protein